MDTAWAFAVLLVVILVIFVILPIFTRAPPAPVRKIDNSPITQPIRDVLVDAPPTVAQASLAQERERCIDREMLKSFYPPPLVKDTPVDYPRIAIGACPYSKPQSHELPAADIPMYMCGHGAGETI
jgi:hypothetical protein